MSEAVETAPVYEKRKVPFFIVENEIIDRMAAQLGPYALSVYFALCRYAGRRQECHPSAALMAAKLGMSVNAVRDALKALSDQGLIEIDERFNPETGARQTNSYTVLSAPDLPPTPYPGEGRAPHQDPVIPPTRKQEGIKTKEIKTQEEEEGIVPASPPDFNSTRAAVASLASEEKATGPVIDIEPEPIEVPRRARAGSIPKTIPFTAKDGFGPAELLALWNSVKDPDLPTATMTPGREEQAKGLLRVIPDREVWAALIKRLNESDFCRGLNKTGWKADFDFLIKDQTNIAKISEGKYDNREVPRDERKHFQEG